ncbi:MAG: polysaccharide deacetylase family protein [Chthoniobacterales bacterium]
MLLRFAIIPLVLALNFPGCKKNPNSASATPKPGASPTAVAAVAATATPVPTPAKPAIDQSAEVVIYGYHRFEKTVRRPDTEMTPEMFEAQMKDLQDKKIPVIGLQDFLAWKRGEKSIPSRAAVITFDDGWKTQYEVGWPIMKKYGYPFTLFIYTEGVKGGKFGGGAAMSWEQLAEMRDAGVDIQAHSATHQDLRRPFDKVQKKKLSSEEYQTWLQAEIAGSKQTLEQKLGIRVTSFAVPFGYVNDEVRETIMKAGYEALFTVQGQALGLNSPNNSLGRYLMEGNKPKVFTDALNFGGGSSTATGAMSVPTTALKTEPPDGATINNSLPLVKADLSSLGPIEQGSVQMRLSGLGLVPASFDEKTQTVSYQTTQKLRDKSCTVIVSAKSGPRKVEASWTFSIEEGGAAASPPPPAAASPAKK